MTLWSALKEDARLECGLVKQRDGLRFPHPAVLGVCLGGHCRSEREALALQQALDRRFGECGLVLHPEKTKVVYCKDTNRKREFNAAPPPLGEAIYPHPLPIVSSVNPTLIRYCASICAATAPNPDAKAASFSPPSSEQACRMPPAGQVFRLPTVRHVR